jgi:cytidylate kinase
MAFLIWDGVLQKILCIFVVAMEHSKKIIITIDGWSSCGKSTLAKQLARELHYMYIDSGAMYRAITLYFLRHHVDWTHPNAVAHGLREVRLEFVTNHKHGQTETWLNGENVEYLIRDLIVAEKVSEVAAVPAVREFAVAKQQDMGKDKGIVMDGRDIGTTVFPEAELKIFMTAEEKIRVQRRYKELYEKNPNITLEEVRHNLATRDYIDSHRAVSPLRQAEDAIVLDNSHLTMKQQLEIAIGWARQSQGRS